MKRTGSAVWQGGLVDGKGWLSTESLVLENSPYSFAHRFGEPGSGEKKGLNPEELIAAAHAACFSMALSAHLQKAGLAPEAINTTATVTVEKLSDEQGGWTITGVHLDLRAQVHGVERVAFEQAAEGARRGCPVSKLLNVPVTLNAHLISTDSFELAG